jgi:hypothetical protein
VAGRVEAAYPLALPARALAVAADDRHAYLLAALDGPRVYVPNPFGGEVWALDWRTGRPVRTIPVGRAPMGITLGAS